MIVAPVDMTRLGEVAVCSATCLIVLGVPARTGVAHVTVGIVPGGQVVRRMRLPVRAVLGEAVVVQAVSIGIQAKVLVLVVQMSIIIGHVLHVLVHM